MFTSMRCFNALESPFYVRYFSLRCRAGLDGGAAFWHKPRFGEERNDRFVGFAVFRDSGNSDILAATPIRIHHYTADPGRSGPWGYAHG